MAIHKGKFILWGDGPAPCFPGFVTVRKRDTHAIARFWLLCPKVKKGWDFRNPVRFPRAEFNP